MDVVPHAEIPEKVESPEEVLVNAEKQAEVQELLQSLKPLDRAIVILRYWYEYSYEDIAKTLTITISAVKSRLNRSKKKLITEWMQKKPTSVQLERIHYGSPAF